MGYGRRESFTELGDHPLLPISFFGALENYDRFGTWSACRPSS